MATITGKHTESVSFTEVAPTTYIGAPTLSVAETPTTSYSNGTAASQVDLIHAKTYTLAATPTTIDLTSLTDLFGSAVNLARLRHVSIRNTSTTAGQNVTIGAAATNAWVGPLGTTTSTFVLPPGGMLSVDDPLSTGGSQGWFVSGTSKSLKLDPAANTVSVDVIFAGTSVA